MHQCKESSEWKQLCPIAECPFRRSSVSRKLSFRPNRQLAFHLSAFNIFIIKNQLSLFADYHKKMGDGTPKALHCSSIVSPALAITGSDELTNRSSTGSRSCTEIERMRVIVLYIFFEKNSLLSTSLLNSRLNDQIPR